MSENLRTLGEYSAAMEAGDTDAVYEFWSKEFESHPPSGEPVEINGTAILRMRDGKIVEHWGGPHCQEGLGLIR
jgi:ketosteroid isomerase-like protein